MSSTAFRPSRRLVLAGAGAMGATFAAPSILRAAPLAQIALYGPPAAPSIVLAHAIAAGMLAELAPEITLTTWRTPDELRAGLTSGTIDLSVMPVQVVSNLYNRGMGVGLVNTMTDGLLHIVAAEGEITDLAGLQGKRLAVPFVNDTPDFVLRALLDAQGLSDAVEQVPVGSPIEAAQMLLAGQIDAALLSEPASTVAVMRGIPAGRHLARVIDLQEEWGRQTGEAPVLPQAGLAATQAFLDRGRELLPQLQAALEQATAAVLADPGRAASDATAALEMPAPVLALSIPHSRLVTRPASQSRPAIESMLSLMGKGDPAIIGGQLPDDGFYLL